MGKSSKLNTDLSHNNRTILSYGPHSTILCKMFMNFHLIKLERGSEQCSQRGSPSVLSQDEDGRQFVVPSGHFLKLPDK